LPEQREPRSLKSAKAYSARGSKSKKGLQYYGYGVELGFAVTNHKVQGRTLSRVLVDLESSGHAQHSVSSLYVAISRVRSSAHVRSLCSLSPSARARLEE